MNKKLKIALYAPLLLAVALAVAVYVVGRSQGFFRAPVYETEPVALPVLNRPAVLVFSKTNAFNHAEAIPAAKELVRRLAEANGWSVFLSDSGALFNATDLAKFDVVVWNNVTGDVLNAEQRRAFEQYIEGGGGFVGLHGAGDASTRKNWPWYAVLIGPRFTGHPMNPQFQTATLHLEPDSITRDLDPVWQRSDEWYSFQESARKPGFQILATLDESTYRPEAFGMSLRMGEDHPLIWKHCVKNGRAFYSALGHTAASYREPKYEALLRNALAWAAGLEGEGCSGGSR